MAGFLCSSVSHALLTPLDTLKCNVQAHNAVPSIAKAYQSLSRPLRASLGQGLLSTFAGYGAHGAIKFGLYDFFKHRMAVSLGADSAKRYRDLVYLVSSVSAEFLACVALCPLEAAKVRAQVQVPATSRAAGTGAAAASAWVGLGALWARQIPYSVVKFMSFERVAEAIYAMSPKAKEAMTMPEHFGVVLTTGWVTGVFCGAVSHPADVLVTRLNLSPLQGSLFARTRVIVDEIGMRGLLKGFAPRVFAIGTMSSIQWMIYGSYKAFAGLPTPGGF
jgi:solute carrier family 25 phosphate transporter 3